METIVKKQVRTIKANSKDIAMTYRQLKKKVGEAWAFLGNPVYERGILTSANLLYYDTDKKKVLEQIPKQEKGHFAIHFFGTIDPKQVYIL